MSSQPKQIDLARFEEEILRAIYSPANAAWVRVGQYKIYARRQRISFEGIPVKVVALGNIINTYRKRNTSLKTTAKSSGNFYRMILAMERISANQGFWGVYIENVLNEFLPAVFHRYGYTRMPENEYNHGAPPCFYKRVQWSNTKVVRENFSWYVNKRLDYIATRLAKGYALNRSDICEEFDISLPQAAHDIKTFLSLYPDAMTYDGSAKQYIPNQKFTLPPSRRIYRADTHTI